MQLERDVSELEKAGIGQIHVDILDGHFSPSMPLGLDAGYHFMLCLMQARSPDRICRKIIVGLRNMITKRGLNTEIAIDGRVSQADIMRFGVSEVNSFVIGSTCLRRGELRESLAYLQALRRKVLEEIV